MLMDKGADTGDILLEEKIRISDEDTTETLSEKLSGLRASLLLKTIKGIKEDSIKPRPQTGEASYAPIIKKRMDCSTGQRQQLNYSILYVVCIHGRVHIVIWAKKGLKLLK